MLKKIATRPLNTVPIELRRGIICLFVFLGPLGALLNFHIFPKATRTYYFILFLFPFLYIDFKKTSFEKLVIFLPIFFYILLSSIYSEFCLPLLEDAYPFVRFALLLCHFLFLVGSVDYLKRHMNISLKEFIKLYLFGYFLTFFIGMFLYIGFFVGIFSLSVIEKINILTQYGWGFLRFNPGSYANEYSVTSSFVLCLLFLKSCYDETLTKKKIFFLAFLIFFSFVGMLLATTRTSLLSFSLSLCYLMIKNKKIRKKIYILFFCLVLFLLFLKSIGINFISFLIKSSWAALKLEGSVLTRLTSYRDGFLLYKTNPMFGKGFGGFPYFHNLYLQYLFELGIFGLFFLFIPLLSLFTKGKSKEPFDAFQKQICIIGFIHIFTFALTNHNLFHHLTWFIFLLCALKLKREPAKEEDLSFET